MVSLFPLIFIILWSSAFITSKIIVENSTPFFALGLRFLFVSLGFYLFILLFNEKFKIRIKLIIFSCISGIFFHVLYLGGVFYSIYIGLPANISALIVSMHPILTNLLAGPILKEKTNFYQWFGILLAFIGIVLVLGYDIGDDIPMFGIIFSIIALFGATIGTLWQKKFNNNLPITINNFYQAFAACILFFIIMYIFETPNIELNTKFIFSMTWQIVAVSFGAFTILMYLIKSNSATKTSNLFFLIPPLSAIMAWLFLNEKINSYDICGFIFCSIGVYFSINYSKSK